MRRLSPGRWEEISAVLHEIYGETNPHLLREKMLSAILRLIPGNYASYNELNLETRHFLILDFPRVPELQKLVPVFQTYAHQHPLYQAVRQGNHDPLKISDFSSFQEFGKTDLYNNYYRPLGSKHQMGLFLTPANRTNIGFVLNRGREDFLEEERTVLQILSPHFRQAFANAQAAHRILEVTGFQAKALEGLHEGIVLLDNQMGVEWASKKAQVFLERYFQKDQLVLKGLPEDLLHWLKRQIAQHHPADPPSPAQPLTIQNQKARLIIRYIRDLHQSRLILKEETRGIPPQIQVQFRLTRREAEILDWICQGKSNGEIAIILGISPRTVHKHVEHLFEKLQVENRAGAIALVSEFKS